MVTIRGSKPSSANTPDSHASGNRDACGATPSSHAARECDCPEWVTRCCHFDGTLLLLSEPGRVDGSCSESRTVDFAVYSVRDVPSHPCVLGCPTRHWWGREQVGHSGLFDTEADALAAFYAAEEALLRGDA